MRSYSPGYSVCRLIWRGVAGQLFVTDSMEAQLRELVAAQTELIASQAETIRVQAEQLKAQAEQIRFLTARVADLERRLGADSSNSSRPPSSDAPWDKQPAEARSVTATVGPQTRQAARRPRGVPVVVRRPGPDRADRAAAMLELPVPRWPAPPPQWPERRQVVDLPRPRRR